MCPTIFNDIRGNLEISVLEISRADCPYNFPTSHSSCIEAEDKGGYNSEITHLTYGAASHLNQFINIKVNTTIPWQVVSCWSTYCHKTELNKKTRQSLHHLTIFFGEKP